MKTVNLFRVLAFSVTVLSAQATYAAGMSSSVVSNTCNSDSTIRLAEHSTNHYSAYSSKPFSLVNKSCEIKLRVKTLPGYKAVLKEFFTRGNVSFAGSTASGHYGMSVRTADDKNYVGGSLGLNATQNFSVVPNFRRGTGSTCGSSVDIIVRHDGGATQPHNTQMKVDYHAFYVDHVRC